MWQSYLELGGSKPLAGKGYSKRKIPRFAFSQRFELLYLPELEVKHWLKLRDSLDSSKEGRVRHDKLMVPLSISSFHLDQMDKGEVKTVRILKDSHHKWWIIFTVAIEIAACKTERKPPALLCIDLGINKAACSALLTQKGYKYVRYWQQDKKSEHLQKIDDRIASLQRKKEQLVSMDKSSERVTAKLRELSGKQARISSELDKKLVRDISDQIKAISVEYNLYVAIGKLKGIRNNARRGNHRGKKYRRMIHRWAFARVSNMLQHKLASLGLDKKFRVVPEQWTSIMCHKCGHRGIRPKQNLFICTTCGYKANADLNGAINIGKRLIMLIPSLRDEKGLGMWLTPRDRAILKARREKSSSEGKSSPPQRAPASKGRSVADCYDQTILESFASSEDPAMVNAVEMPSVSRPTGESGTIQRTEARSHRRNDVPMKKGKTCDSVADYGQGHAGDSGREKDRTQEFLAVHSYCRR